MIDTQSDLQLLCLLDVLGFESLLKTLGLAIIKAKYTRLIEYVKQQTGGVDIVQSPEGHVAVGQLVIGNAYFSDSLLFWTRYGKMSLPSFTHCIADAICFGLEIELPLRGAIAVGEAILDAENGVFLGEPLVEVARSGGSVHLSVLRSLGLGLATASICKPSCRTRVTIKTVQTSTQPE